MPSYLITGASRGLGFAFTSNLSADPNNTVIGLVRNKQATDEKIGREIPQRSNLHIIQADVGDYDALKASVDEVSKITGGSLDYIIANAAFQGAWSAYEPLSVLGTEPKRLEDDLVMNFRVNVVGNIHLFNLFTPLIQKGQAKKVIYISSGMAETELISKYSVHEGAPYSISKAAGNTAVAKFDAQYREEGILFMSISPGVVATEGAYNMNQLPGAAELAGKMAAKFSVYAPDWKGPLTPQDSVTAVLSVVNKASIEAGYGGSFVSHHGDKNWL